MDNNQLKTTAKYAYILGVASSIVALIKWLYLRYTLPAVYAQLTLQEPLCG